MADILNAFMEFPARIEALTPIHSLCDAACRKAGFVDIDALRVRLVLEELVSNTIFHGYPSSGMDAIPDEQRRIWLLLTPEPGELLIDYRDAAPPFDPSRLSPMAPIPDRVGGVGLHLIAGATDSLRYLREDGYNRLLLRFRVRDRTN